MAKLLHPPYRPPAAKVGDTLHCAYYDDDVEVIGVSPAKAKWPLCCVPSFSGRLIPILCGDLIRAVAVESVAAVSEWWGVSRYTVGRWRRKLGIGRFNEGTRRLWRDLAGKRLSLAARQLGGKRSHARLTKIEGDQ